MYVYVCMYVCSRARVSWYQKWRVHLYARPEALGGVLHNTLVGNMTSTLHASLLDNHELLSRVAYSNSMQNEDGEATYLLPMVIDAPPSPPYTLSLSLFCLYGSYLFYLSRVPRIVVAVVTAPLVFPAKTIYWDPAHYGKGSWIKTPFWRCRPFCFLVLTLCSN